MRWVLGWLNGQYYIDGLIINSVEGIRLIGQNGSLVNLLIHMDCKGDIMTKIMNIYYHYYHIFMKCHGSVLSNSVGDFKSMVSILLVGSFAFSLILSKPFSH